MNFDSWRLLFLFLLTKSTPDKKVIISLSLFLYKVYKSYVCCHTFCRHMVSQEFTEDVLNLTKNQQAIKTLSIIEPI